MIPLRQANVYPTGIQLIINIGGVLIWAEIDDTQNPNWQNIISAQGGTWVVINDTQTANWQNIGNAQGGGWVDVNDTQAPGWTQIPS